MRDHSRFRWPRNDRRFKTRLARRRGARSRRTLLHRNAVVALLDYREKRGCAEAERSFADIVGGRLKIWSRLDSGTEVELGIPAAIAYDVSTRESAAIVSGNGRRNRSKEL
ncbi:MAG: hypothetical protein ND866_03935 [Pyrinomonadaceae bacterium]|nr:hypothetical protein [Pyrinomonadaceae bacterium]